MKYLLKPNIFMIFVLIAVFAFTFRLSNVITAIQNNTSPAQTIAVAQAVEDADGEEPPELHKKTASKETEDKIQKERSLPPFPIASFSESEMKVLQSLAERRRQLKEKEDELNKRQALLEIGESEINNKITELKALQEALKKLLNEQQNAQEKRVRKLVKIYENMKPKDAARIFDTLEMEVLLEVLNRMSERKTAPIFSKMNPEIAKTVTLKLMEQKKLPSLPQ